ncbi:SPOR domain-containing protein [Histidinibacterium lentulum]|uniref:SPOR domain-containing protein n=1 Tax=Histidinibacterium lentulum TaxID=2480588 RepID=A0A3N2R9Y3_9RHOB|nr:SPOR domain-containing protein [Histidinibacterium lentulum]ROU04279.1 SPOR domain-containing protein [Histidinibacterium lentulum]
MADYTYEAEASGSGVSAGSLVNMVGAALSLTLIAGIGVWGYNLVLRDVSGVPVVRAMEGPMRIAPDEPGGELAAHRGLAVNAVAAEGGAAPPEDRLMLAPVAVDLAAEDLAVAPATDDAADADEAVSAVSGMIAAATAADAPVEDLAALEDPAAADPDAPLSQEDILALADQIAAGLTPMSRRNAEDVPDVILSIDGTPVRENLSLGGAEVIPASVPGVARSLRPQSRPMRLSSIEPIAAETAAVPPTLDPQSIAPGTALVQLGAYDSEAVAAAEWAALAGRFGALMAGRPRIVQEAETGGRTFWRLRAGGFDDLADARRFCAALVAEDAVCIPVSVR